MFQALFSNLRRSYKYVVMADPPFINYQSTLKPHFHCKLTQILLCNLRFLKMKFFLLKCSPTFITLCYSSNHNVEASIIHVRLCFCCFCLFFPVISFNVYNYYGMKNHSADKVIRNKSLGDHYNQEHRYVKEIQEVFL